MIIRGEIKRIPSNLHISQQKLRYLDKTSPLKERKFCLKIQSLHEKLFGTFEIIFYHSFFVFENYLGVVEMHVNGLADGEFELPIYSSKYVDHFKTYDLETMGEVSISIEIEENGNKNNGGSRNYDGYVDYNENISHAIANTANANTGDYAGKDTLKSSGLMENNSKDPILTRIFEYFGFKNDIGTIYDLIINLIRGTHSCRTNFVKGLIVLERIRDMIDGNFGELEINLGDVNLRYDGIDSPENISFQRNAISNATFNSDEFDKVIGDVMEKEIFAHNYSGSDKDDNETSEDHKINEFKTKVEYKNKHNTQTSTPICNYSKDHSSQTISDLDAINLLKSRVSNSIGESSKNSLANESVSIPPTDFEVKQIIVGKTYKLMDKKFYKRMKNLLYYAAAPYSNIAVRSFIKKRRAVDHKSISHKLILEWLDIDEKDLLVVNLKSRVRHIIFRERNYCDRESDCSDSGGHEIPKYGYSDTTVGSTIDGDTYSRGSTYTEVNEDKFYPTNTIYPDRLVISFRGTENIEDAVNDLECAYFPFMDGYAHKGILDLTRHFLESEFKTVEKLMYRHRTRNLLLTGTSLGGAIAAIAFILLKEKNLEWSIQCTIFSAPPVVSKNIAARYPEIESVTFGNDIVSRLCYGTALDLKYLATSIGRNISTFKSRNYSDLKKYADEISQYLSESDKFPKLHLPGVIYHVVGVDMKNVLYRPDNSTDRPNFIDKVDGPVGLVRKTDSTDFMEIKVDRFAIIQHMPWYLIGRFNSSLDFIKNRRRIYEYFKKKEDDKDL